MKSFILFSFWTSISIGLGIPISMFVVWVITPPLNSTLGLALSDVEYLAEQIEQFHAKTHQYPKTHETLNEALHKVDRHSPIRKREKTEGQCLLIPLEDPWGRAYRYCFPGLHRKNAFDLFSLGQDGQPNTRDDITIWDQSSLEAAYSPSWIRKLFRDYPLLGVELFWFGITVFVSAMLVIMRQSALLKPTSLFSSSYLEGFIIILGSVFISAIFLLIVTLPPILISQLASNMDSISIKGYRFHSKVGRYPHTLEELQKVFSQDSPQPLVERIQSTEGLYFLIPIKDPWGQNYRYRSPGFHHPESFDLWSLGQDGQMGTIDDVKSWDNSWRRYYGPGVFRQFLYDHPLLSLAIFWWGIAILLKCLEWLLYGRIKEVEKNK